jgi:hypothetical protein
MTHEQIDRRASLAHDLRQKTLSRIKHRYQKPLHPVDYHTKKTRIAIILCTLFGGLFLAIKLTVWPVTNDSLKSWMSVYSAFFVGGIVGIALSKFVAGHFYIEDVSQDDEYIEHLLAQEAKRREGTSTRRIRPPQSSGATD